LALDLSKAPGGGLTGSDPIALFTALHIISRVPQAAHQNGKAKAIGITPALVYHG
jgi:hypothetical protein